MGVCPTIVNSDTPIHPNGLIVTLGSFVGGLLRITHSVPNVGRMSTQTVGMIPEWTVGDRLRKAREWRGLTQYELASAVGVSRNSVSNYEVGATEPRRIVLNAWAMATGVSLNWLLSEGGTPPGLHSDQKPPGLRYGRSSFRLCA